MKIKQRYKDMAEIYEYFATRGKDDYDFSDEALLAMFAFESKGISLNLDKRRNGFYIGKHWMDVCVAMWLEDIARGNLFLHELYNDGAYPHWWLDKVLSSIIKDKDAIKNEEFFNYKLVESVIKNYCVNNRLTEEFKNTLKLHIENRMITGRRHPSLPLTIYKYTKEAQYSRSFETSFSEAESKQWDDVLLSCRGLIVDDKDNIVAEPFKKFFNQQELPVGEIESRKHLDYSIQEKADGSLGILFDYNAEWIMATQGSFTSEQANLGMDILFSKYSHLKLHPNYIYLVEIVSPLNRIVVSYEESDLILLAIKDRLNNFIELDLNRYNPGFTQVEEFNHLDLSSLKQLNWENKEGFVVKFSDGFRYKVKFDEYLRLHSVLTELSSKHVLQAMSSGTFYSKTLQDTPDEFYAWLKSTEDLYNSWYSEIHKEIVGENNKLINNFKDTQPTRKDVALYLKGTGTKHFSFLISNWGCYNQDETINKYVWNLVEAKRKDSMVKSGDLTPKTFLNSGK